MEKICCSCGAPVEVHLRNYHCCDNCGRQLCDKCWNELHTVYTDKLTKMNMVGFIKVCKDCESMLVVDKVITVEPNQYIN